METGDFSGAADEAGRFKTQNLIEGMGKIGYDVVNLGERDLSWGVAEFRSLAEKSGLVFISASFVYRDNGEQFLQPYSIKQYKLASGKSVRVGFLGVNSLNSAFVRETPEKRILIVRDPIDAMKLYLPALKGKVDLVVVLANISLRDLTGALTAVPGVDLVLASYGGRLSPGTFETIAGVPVLYSGDQGKNVGEVRIKFAGKGVPPVMTASQILLTQRYPADPHLEGLVQKTVARVNEINRQKATAAAPAFSVGPVPTPAGPGSTVAPPPRTPPAPPRVKTFLTALACGSCHAEAQEVYLQSAHSRAFDTLVKANQDYNPECVKCHVTGFDKSNGFINARQTPELTNVQCEACHGNAAEHSAEPEKPFGKVPPRTCFTCHTRERSPDFAFYKYWDKIKH